MTATKGSDPSGADEPRWLAGGNPQNPTGDGDAPGQASLRPVPPVDHRRPHATGAPRRTGTIIERWFIVKEQP